jgi:DNA primase
MTKGDPLMPGSTWADFKAVKAAVSIEAVLTRYGFLEKFDRKGNRLAGPCPIHKGSNKRQFSVSLEKGAWKCFSGHCGKAGNVIDLVAAIENVPFRDAALLLQSWFGIEPGQGRGGEATGPPAPTTPAASEVLAGGGDATVEGTNTPLTFELKLEPADSYLESRGLVPETGRHFGLGLATRGSMKGRLVIPIRNEKGELVAYAGRWVGQDENLPKGEGKYRLPPNFHKSLVVYNLERVPPATKTVVLVEGFFSVFWLHQNAFPNAVSLMGTSLSKEQGQLLGERFKGVQVFFDGDEAGRKAASAVAGELARRIWVKIIECPEGLQPDRLPAEDLKRLL